MRIGWNEYFTQLLNVIKERSTCERLKVGALIVKGNNVIATGYNGAVNKAEHCMDVGCMMDNGHCIRTVHAEMNAITQCAKLGVSTEGATMYVTHFPCIYCTKHIIQAGIKEIRYMHDYKNDERAIKLLKDSGVFIIKIT